MSPIGLTLRSTLIASLFLIRGPAFAAQTGQGPSSPEEARVLWSEGQKDFEAAHYDQAIFELSRLIERYPSFEGFTDAHLLLGKTYLATRKPELALEPLRYYIQAMNHAHETQAARALLARAYLDSHHYNEAMQTGRELVSGAKPGHDPMRVQGLLIKCEAWIGLNRDADARAALDSAKKDLAPGETELAVSAGLLELRLKTRFCARFPSAGPLDEGQVREQLERRGNCLLEAELLFRDLLKKMPDASPPAVEQALLDTELAFVAFHRACQTPPKPPGKRSASELAKYRAELKDALKQDCRRKLKSASDLASGWKDDLPPAATPLREKLEKKVAELESP